MSASDLPEQYVKFRRVDDADDAHLRAIELAETMWDGFMAHLNVVDPLLEGRPHVSFIGSAAKYRERFLDAVGKDAADQLRAYGDKRARDAVEALQRLVKSFPTDADMIAAGWEGPEINEACEAFDEAMRALAAAPTLGEKT